MEQPDIDTWGRHDLLDHNWLKCSPNVKFLMKHLLQPSISMRTKWNYGTVAAILTYLMTIGSTSGCLVLPQPPPPPPAETTSGICVRFFAFCTFFTDSTFFFRTLCT